MSTNIDYWEEIIKNPSPLFKKLFDKEKEYLNKEIKPNSKVLDVGCGTGRNILSIIDITKDIVGIDNDQKSIKDTKNNLKNHPSVDIKLADAINIPFKDDMFDYVICMMVFYNFGENKKQVLNEMKRVSKNNGKIILSVYSDKAIKERLSTYSKIGVPIKEIRENGYLIFDESVGANISEQFSKEQINEIVENAGLKITNIEEVDSLAYILTLEKIL